VIGIVSSERFFTAYGFATESPASPFYRDNGYWRGPIWAPSTMLMIDGLEKCGEATLAQEAARRFVAMTANSGFAENFDARTGEGLCDLAYTWTASVALVLARDYLV
jgi:glycogen debranching enzyme